MAGPKFVRRAAWVSISVRRLRPAVRMLMAAGTLIGLTILVCVGGVRCAAPKVARVGASVHDELFAGGCVVPDVSSAADCGWVGISESTCLAKGCCFKDMGRNSKTPWCFQKTPAATAIQKCAIPDGERKECGFSTITAAECHSRGCCFLQAKMNGAPWCFYASSVMASTSTATTSTVTATSTSHIRDGNSTVSSHHSSQTTSTSYQVNTSSTMTTHPNMELIVANDAIHPSQPSRHADSPTAQESNNDTIVFAHAANPSRRSHDWIPWTNCL